jgi:hypothetical protein
MAMTRHHVHRSSAEFIIIVAEWLILLCFAEQTSCVAAAEETIMSR